MPPTQVEVAEVVRRDVAPTQRLVGSVRPRLRTVVAAEVAGQVAELPIDDGDAVEKEQVLCRLRDEPRRLARDEARARLAELESVKEERTAQLAKTEFESGRMTTLWKDQRCTEKEYRDALADHQAAEGRAKQAEHAVASQRAVCDRLADDLARTEIRAPCDGFVTERQTQIGSWVELGGPIVEMVDLSVARVRVSVPEGIIGFCTVGEPGRVTVEAIHKSYPGKIARVIPDADERARTFPVDIDVPNPEGELRAGMFVRAEVPAGPRGARLIVPKDAVVLRGTERTAYVVREGTGGARAEAIQVEVLAELADELAVKSAGLAEGDKVVVRGNENMFGPSPVVVTKVHARAGGATTQPATSG
jgi:RND family efflux transporter MFP subunit